MQDASKGELKGILDYNTAPLVSIDFNHCPASCTFDATQTAVVDGALARVMGWYDNEWGFSNRMSDTAALLGSLYDRHSRLSPRLPAIGRRARVGAGARSTGMTRPLRRPL